MAERRGDALGAIASDWTELVELEPGKGADARELAQQINLAARLAV
jgi:hypothetical protein